MAYDAGRHWESIYRTKKPGELSWHQEKPETSLNLIVETGIERGAGIIDVGAGDSKLVDNLLDLGFRNITVLDVSPTALERAKKRLGSRADTVKWVISDVREFETGDRYDLWHDRAVLHFLANEEDVNNYVAVVRRVLKPGGYFIVSAFSLNGPKKCSGLDIRQYSEGTMKKLFSDFEHLKSFEEVHVTPWGASQMFLCSVFRKKPH